MSDERTSWKLDLDTAEFMKKANQAFDTINKIGVADLSGLIGGLSKATLAVGTIAAAFYAAKTAIDTIVAAENIKAINAEFEMLAKNAGLAADAIKDRLVNAADGLVDDTDLMRAANKAIIQMGENANKIPETMELARKASAAFGGDILSRFEQINQAIAAGNVRQLKSIGIIIDQEKAYKDFAKTLGVSVDMLSEAGKKQAILEAALAKGKDAFKGVDENARGTANALQRLSVAISDIGETFTLLFDKVFGKGIRKMVEEFAAAARLIKNDVKAIFADGKEQQEAAYQGNAQRIEQLTEKIAKMRAEAEKMNGVVLNPGELKSYEQALDRLQKKQEELRSKGVGAEAPAAAGAEGTSDADKQKFVDREREKKAETEFQADLLRIKQERLRMEMEQEQSTYQMDLLVKEQKHLTEQEYDLKLKQIRENKHFDETEKAALEVELQRNKTLEIEKIENESRERRLQAMRNETDQSKSMIAGVSNAFKEGAETNRQALTNWGNTGRLVFNSFGNHARKAMLDWGAGTKTAGEAVKGIMFGVIADTAEAKGMELLLSGLWPPNPVALAAGAGLVALAGLLRSQAQGTSGSEIGASGASGGGGSISTPTTDAGEKPDTPEMKEKKVVTLQVMGNYFETEQTKTKLVELIREATDATDFAYKQIGQS